MNKCVHKECKNEATGGIRCSMCNNWSVDKIGDDRGFCPCVPKNMKGDDFPKPEQDVYFILPCFNEEATIGGILRAMAKANKS